MNVIASKRAEAFMRHLPKFGIEPVMITNHFDPSKTMLEIDEFFGEKVIRLPYQPLEYRKRNLLSKILVLINWSRGDFDSNGVSSHYKEYYDFLLDHLKKEKYDAIISIYSPHYHLKLCYELNKIFNIPYVLDFRDLWNNLVMSKNYTAFSLFHFLRDFLVIKYWEKWLKKTLFISATTPTMVDFIKTKFKIKSGEIITNGFEVEDFRNEITHNHSDTIIISSIGTIYPDQDLEPIFNVLKSLSINHKTEMYFLGCVGDMSNRLLQLVKKYELFDCVKIKEKVDHKDAILHMMSSTILFYPGWKNMPGIIPGKIFEYIGAKKPIVVCPTDNGLVQNIVQNIYFEYNYIFLFQRY